MTRSRLRFSVDTETGLIAPDAIAPKLICVTAAVRDPDTGEIDHRLYGNGDPEMLTMVENLLTDTEVDLVFHNAAFDLTVFANAAPHLMPAIFAALEAGRITDTKIREKLLALSTTGKVDNVYLPDGTAVKVKYSLADLVLKHLGRDRSAEKKGDDIWRLNYISLDCYKAADYPAEAATYALQDAIDTLLVFEAQQAKVLNDMGPASVRTAELHTATDFCLRLMTCWGMAVDPERVAEIDASVQAELTPAKLHLLIEKGILQPAQPPRPHKNKNVEALAEQVRESLPVTATMDELIVAWQAAGVKLTAPTDEKIREKLLHQHIVEVYKANGLEPKKTDKGNICADAEVMDLLAPLDPVIAQYQRRQALQKLVNTYLPHLRGARTMHADYDVLKETGRTSSFAGKSYPSHNVQQEDPRTRPCFIARPGHLICSVDYQAIELVSLAQKCFDLFGYSVHRDLINKGVDLHSYLGTQIALRKHEAFRSMCESRKLQGPLPSYELFKSLEKVDEDFYLHWRGLAKPVGLGFPGGMGAEKFVTMARNSYGVHLTLEEAQELKDIWLDTYPETRDYFRYVQEELGDPNNMDGDGRPLFAYFSPFGMYRAGATYCAAANGNALQTPTAEGAKAAVFSVARASYDFSRGDLLFGCRPLAFIHDQLLVEVPEDDTKHDIAFHIAKLMVDSMQVVMRDVQVRAEPVLMRRWHKKAKPVFDSAGRLQVWKPPEEEQQRAKDQKQAAA